MPVTEPNSPMQDPTSKTRAGTRAGGRPAWWSSRTALLVAGAAFVAGLLIFVALWLDQRDSNNFYRRNEAPRSVAGQVFDPLPVPLPAGEDTASGMGAPGPLPTEAPPDRAPPMAPSTPINPAPPMAPPVAPVPDIADRSVPRLVSSPPPNYPRDARRRRQSGTVLLRIQVGSNGEAANIDIVQSSGTRSLDRAAIDAARRWHFEPAIRNGQPVEGSLQIPIAFAL